MEWVGKFVCDTQVAYLLEPRLLGWLSRHKSIKSHGVQNISSKVTDHTEKRKLSEMYQGRQRKGASKEEYSTVGRLVVQLHYPGECPLVVGGDNIHLLLG